MQSIGLLLAAAASGLAEPVAAIEWITVAEEGREVFPGSPADFEDLEGVVLRDDGTVFFAAWTDRPLTRAIYRWTETTGPQLMANLDQPFAPLGDPALIVEPPGGFLSLSGGLGRDDALLFDFAADIAECPDSPFAEEATFTLDDSGALVPLVQPGQPVPGLDPGWRFDRGAGSDRSSYTSSQPRGNGDLLAFFAGVRQADPCDEASNAPIADALFGPDGQGGYTFVVANGQDLGGGILYPHGLTAPTAAGEIAFLGQLDRSPPASDVAAVYRWSAATGLRLVFQDEIEDPYSGPRPDELVLGEGGHLLFRLAWLLEFVGLYLDDPTTGLRTVIEPGDPLPGISGDYRIHASYEYDVNAAGDVAFRLDLDSVPDGYPLTGIWAPDATGETVLKIATGQPAPYLPGVAMYPSLEAINDERTILVSAKLVGDGVTGKNDRAYYLIDADGRSRLLARAADKGFEQGFLLFDPTLTRFVLHSKSKIQFATVPEPCEVLGSLVALTLVFTLRRRR